MSDQETIRHLSNAINGLAYEMGMTILQFSEYVDIPVDTIKSILYGKSKDCKLSTVLKICRHCNISLDDILKY